MNELLAAWSNLPAGWLDIPLPLRMGWLFIVGGCIGSFLNVVVGRLPAGQSLWGYSHCDQCQVPLKAWQLIPIFGWILVRARCQGCGVAVSWRYPLIEACVATAFAMLYWWEVELRSLYPPGVYPSSAMLHAQYFSHLVLGCFLLSAALIDLDHMVIPDGITMPGTIVGVVLAAVLPWSLLPTWDLFDPQLSPPSFLTLCTLSSRWPAVLQPFPNGWSLVIGIACFWGWCLALFRWEIFSYARAVWKRRDRATAWRIVQRYVGLAPKSRRIFPALLPLYILTVTGPFFIALGWWVGGVHWQGLLTALVGMAGGGAMVWAIRIVTNLSLGEEGLGFGDVTLIAMIGSFLGWQAVILTFVFGVFFGLLPSLLKYITQRDRHVPYGPALCLGAATTVVMWGSVWPVMSVYYATLGTLMLYLIPIGLLVLSPMLMLARAGRLWLEGPEEEVPAADAPTAAEPATTAKTTELSTAPPAATDTVSSAPVVEPQLPGSASEPTPPAPSS